MFSPSLAPKSHFSPIFSTNYPIGKQVTDFIKKIKPIFCATKQKKTYCLTYAKVIIFAINEIEVFA